MLSALERLPHPAPQKPETHRTLVAHFKAHIWRLFDVTVTLSTIFTVKCDGLGDACPSSRDQVTTCTCLDGCPTFCAASNPQLAVANISHLSTAPLQNTYPGSHSLQHTSGPRSQQHQKWTTMLTYSDGRMWQEVTRS